MAKNVEKPEERNPPPCWSAIARSSPEFRQQQLENLDGMSEGAVGVAAKQQPDGRVLLGGDGRYCDLVDLVDHPGLVQAVAEDLLPVANVANVIEAGEQHPGGDFDEEWVPAGHRLEQRVQPEVAPEVVRVVGQRRGRVDVAVGV